MCFAPQRLALFRYLNFQKWSEPRVFCTFWLRNVLRATTACNFSSLIWPAGSFRPSGAANHWRNTMFHDFPTFSRTWIFFLLRLSLAPGSSFFWDFLFLLLFSSLLFSDSSHLCFSSVHIVGSLTSKLPSISCRFVAVGFWKCKRNRSRADWSLASCTFKTTSHPRHKGWQERTNKTFDSTLAERLRRVSRFLWEEARFWLIYVHHSETSAELIWTVRVFRVLYNHCTANQILVHFANTHTPYRNWTFYILLQRIPYRGRIASCS